jgi:hypothetical protein
MILAYAPMVPATSARGARTFRSGSARVSVGGRELLPEGPEEPEPESTLPNELALAESREVIRSLSPEYVLILRAVIIEERDQTILGDELDLSQPSVPYRTFAIKRWLRHVFATRVALAEEDWTGNSGVV